MRAVGLITEYNPLHNGHQYHLQKAKQLTGADVAVVVMSGNWVQRGEPAILDKWTRAQLALASGADLVIELPVFDVIQPAHLFAEGAVELLAALHCESLIFGAEHPELDFQQMVQAFPTDRQQFRRYDATYATLFNQAMQQKTGQTLTAANDVLAFGYHLANERLGNPLKLVAIQRKNATHADVEIATKQSFASGTAIRQAALNQDWQQIKAVVPPVTFQSLESNQLVQWDDFWPQLQYQTMTAPLSYQKQLYQMSEGLEHRLRDRAQHAQSFDELLKEVKTKRFTYSRLQRVLTAELLQLRTSEVEQAQEHRYLRVLGFSRLGQAYLHSVKKQIELPLITKITQKLRIHELSLDYRAGKVYQLVNGAEQDLYRRPLIV